MKLKLLSFVLALALICASFAACDTQNPNTPEVTTDVITTDGSAVTTETPTETTSDKAAPITPQNAKGVKIVHKPTVSAELLMLIGSLSQKISSSFGFSAPSKIYGDSATVDGVTEIVIGGECDGSEILRPDDFLLSMQSEDIYVCAGSDASLLRAVTYLTEGIGNGLMLDLDEPTYVYGNYPIKAVTVNGVSLAKYCLVLSDTPSVYEAYAAEIFLDYVNDHLGYKLKKITDKDKEEKYELILGETDRAESKADITLSDGKYSVFASGSDIVCIGDDHTVAAGLYELISAMPADGGVHTLSLTKEASAKTFEYKKAKSAILLIGDGMGFNSIAMAKYYKTCPEFYAYDLPTPGKSMTNNVSGSTTDSAAGGTALSAGYKTVNGYLGVDKNGTAVMNVRELADTMGAKTAILTTDAITGATPSAFLAHHTSRNDTAILQNQINALMLNKKVEFAEGNLGDNLLPRTRTVLDSISKNGSSFFLMVEEGYIDKYSHSNEAASMSLAVKRFNSVIAYCMVFTVFNPDTVLIITADHETGGITENNGTYYYTSGGHTSTPVPIFACGVGTEQFHGKIVQNTSIAKFIATVYGAKSFGN